MQDHAKHSKLERFFSKLVMELVELSIDELSIVADRESLTLSMMRGGGAVKTIQTKPEWWPLIEQWFLERYDPLSEVTAPRALSAGRDHGPFNARLFSGDAHCCIECRVERRAGTAARSYLHARQIVRREQAAYFEALGVERQLWDHVYRAMSAEHGILLLAVPPQHDVARVVAAVVGGSRALYLGEISAVSPVALTSVAEGDLAVVTVSASDPIEALLKVRQDKERFQRSIVGVLGMAMVRRLCVDCARETPPDPRLLDQLPPRYRPTVQRYLVGRGCDGCAHTGYFGSLALQSVALVDSTAYSILERGADETRLVEHFSLHGLRPLLADGVSKAFAGHTTLEEVLNVIRTVPDVYLRMPVVSDEPRVALQPPLAGMGLFVDTGHAPQPSHDTQSVFRVSDAPQVSSARRKPLLMVVEDDPDQREILELVLKTANYDVVVAGDGVEGLDVVKKHRPDVIVTDLMMPRLDGEQFITKLRADPATATIPILVLTVVSDVDKEYALLDSGADDYCAKSVQRRILLKRIERLARRAEQGAVVGR